MRENKAKRLLDSGSESRYGERGIREGLEKDDEPIKGGFESSCVGSLVLRFGLDGRGRELWPISGGTSEACWINSPPTQSEASEAREVETREVGARESPPASC